MTELWWRQLTTNADKLAALDSLYVVKGESSFEIHLCTFKKTLE
jgi:hypothetical protein